MKGKSTKSALLMSFTSLLLCFAMLIGTTFAWFTDSVTSGVNKIQAGNLDIEVTHSNAHVSPAESIEGVTAMFTDASGHAMLWEPGAMSYENFTVKNVGTLALKYNMSMNVVDFNAVRDTNDNLKDALKVKVLTGSEILPNPTREAVANLPWNDAQTLDQFKKDGGKLYPAGTADQNIEETFQVIVYWQPGENDNRWNLQNGKPSTDGQPLFVNFGVTVVATQLEHEFDSFDNQYDASAQAPNVVMPSWSGEATAPMTTDGATLEYKVSDTTYAKVTVPADAKAGENALNVNDNLKLTVVPSTTPTGVVVDSGESVTTYDVSLVKVVSTTEGGETTTKVTTAEGETPVTVELNIGVVDLQSFSHKGVALDKVDSVTQKGQYSYNQSTGIVTFMTDSFSPFSAVYKFAGGLGNADYPYLIANRDQMQAISELSWTKHAYDSYYGEDHYGDWPYACNYANQFDTMFDAYYKVTDGVKTMDCSNWTPVYIEGSFDGNGVNFNNLDRMLFRYGYGELKNFTIKDCNIVSQGSTAAVINKCGDDILIENVDVSGYIEGQGQTAAYIMYPSSGVTTIKDCTTTTNVVAIGEAAGGFIVNPYMLLSTYGGTAESKIVIDNSYFEGTLATTAKASSNPAAGYVYAHNVNVPVEFMNIAEEKASLCLEETRSGWNNKYWLTASKASNLLGSPATIDMSQFRNGDLISYNRYNEDCVYASISLTISPNGTNETGSFTGTFITEKVNVADGKFTATKVKNLKVAVNGSVDGTAAGVIPGLTAGLSEYNGEVYYNVVGGSYGYSHNGASIVIVQYNSEGLPINYAKGTVAAANTPRS